MVICRCCRRVWKPEAMGPQRPPRPMRWHAPTITISNGRDHSHAVIMDSKQLLDRKCVAGLALDLEMESWHLSQIPVHLVLRPTVMLVLALQPCMRRDNPPQVHSSWTCLCKWMVGTWTGLKRRAHTFREQLLQNLRVTTLKPFNMFINTHERLNLLLCKSNCGDNERQGYSCGDDPCPGVQWDGGQLSYVVEQAHSHHPGEGLQEIVGEGPRPAEQSQCKNGCECCS
jgi:hypothetical protein